MINKDFTYAIVGASNNEFKYGHRVLKDLSTAGYKVVPINLHEQEILGLKAYAKLSDYPGKFDVVDFVVPPAATEVVLKEAKQLGITKVWLQPGSESQAAIDFCQANGIDCIHDMCIMVQRRKLVIL